MNKQFTNSKKPFKPVSKKPTVKDTFNEKCLVVPDDQQSLLLETTLREKLEKTFPRQPKFNWVAVKLPRKLKREQFKQWKEENIQKQIIEKSIEIEHQKFISLGFNTTVKEVQKNSVSTVIISTNLPTKLIEVLKSLCEMKNATLVGLNCLDSLSKEQLGYCCSVMGISSQQDHLFSDIVDQVKEISKSHLANVGDLVTVEEKQKDVPKFEDVVVEKRQKEIADKVGPVRNLHLKRSSRKVRSFVPSLYDGDKSEPPKKRARICDSSSPALPSIYHKTKM